MMEDDDLLSSTELAEKYARLLQPARDLAENWGVDLDHLVQDFIQEAVSQASQAGDRFNFAEAAVLVQGGANVYCRKVDFVYQLALGFCDSLLHKKGKNTGSDDTRDAGEDEEPPDVMDPCTLPNLAKYKPPKAIRWAGEFPDLQERLTHIPMALQPMGAFEKRNVPIVGRNRKEILGKIEDLRLYSCMYYKAFCILMKKFLPYTSQTTLPPKRVRFRKQLEDKENYAPGGDIYQGSFDDDNDFGGGDFGDITPFAEFPDMEQGAPPDAMSTPKQSLESDGQRMSIERQRNQRPSEAAQFADFEYDEAMPEIHETLHKSPDLNDAEQQDEEEEAVWDPEEYNGNEEEDEDGSWPEVRALRPKKCNRDAREAIKQRTKKLEKERKEKKVQRREVIKDYIHATIFRHTVRKRGVRFAQFQAYLCDNAVLALSNIMYEESERRRQMEKELRRRAQEEQRQSRSRSRTARLSNRNAQAPPAEVAPEPEPQEAEFNEFGGVNDYDDGGYEGFDDDDDELGFQVEVDDGPEPIGDIGNEEFDIDDVIVAGSSDIFGHSGIQRSRRGAGHSLIQEREEYDDDSIDVNMDPALLDYADQVRLYVKRYWTDGERLASEMSARVQTWEEKMTTALKKENQHEEFRVHDCGSEIVDTFPDVGKNLSFTKVLKSTKGPQAYKNSRLFLSALMLTNTGNIRIAKRQNEEEEQDWDENTVFSESAQGKKHSALKIKLLTRERHHERFEDEQQHITGDSSDEI